MRDLAHIDFCKQMVEMYAQRLRVAREQHRLFGMGIANMEESLAEGEQALRSAEAVASVDAAKESK